MVLRLRHTTVEHCVHGANGRCGHQDVEWLFFALSAVRNARVGIYLAQGEAALELYVFLLENPR